MSDLNLGNATREKLALAFGVKTNQNHSANSSGLIFFHRNQHIFPDNITLYRLDENDVEVVVPLIRKGIAWESDKKYKFKNPEGDLETGNLMDSSHDP